MNPDFEAGRLYERKEAVVLLAMLVNLEGEELSQTLRAWLNELVEQLPNAKIIERKETYIVL